MHVSDDPDLAAAYAEHLDTQLGRVEAALAAAECDTLVVHAGRERMRPRDDIAYPFRPEPHFAAFVPLLEHPGSALEIVPGRRPRLVYEQSPDFWHAPPEDPAGSWTGHFDIVVTRSPAQTRAALGRPGRRTAVIGAADGDEPGARPERVLAELDFHRARKTEYEIACLARANRIAARGHAAVAAAAGAAESEWDLHQRFLGATLQREVALPYPSIIALNEHAAVLHYQHADAAPPADFRTLLIDAGATCNGYAADVTRTHSAGDARFAELIAALDELQQAVAAEAVPGTDFVALDDGAHARLARVLVEHGIARCTADAALESGLTRVFLPHGLGHLLGLQVHDAGGRRIAPDGTERAPPERSPFLRLTRTLEPGFAVTIEPGLYFIPSLLHGLAAPLARLVDWPLVEALMPYGGIRIEDDVVVRASGSENLTREAFRAAPAAR